MHRTPLCTYYSSDISQLLQELQNAYLALPTQRCVSHIDNQQRPRSQQRGPGVCNRTQSLSALVVPHGASCDGFHVAAHAYRELNDYCQSSRCRHLTAVLLGTEHRGTTPIALSRQAYWATPLGQVPVDTAAVDYLAHRHHIPINEAPHTTEHSIENQLPFLQHGAMHGWDLITASCIPPATFDTRALSTSASRREAAQLSIVPISIGYLGSHPQLIQQYGAAVSDLLRHLQKQEGSGSSIGREVVLIATSDFTHAGPWYKEVPPAGISLEEYMTSQDLPVLQAVQQGSVQELLTAAAAKRNSMCGLYPLAVALEAIYGTNNNSSSVPPSKPQLLEYKPAHMIYQRPDSTGFAAFVIWQ